MTEKLTGCDEPLRSWFNPSWRLYRQMQIWGMYHPNYIAVSLTDRGKASKEMERLGRVHGYQMTKNWVAIPAEKVAKLRPVWVRGFRRLPTREEAQ